MKLPETIKRNIVIDMVLISIIISAVFFFSLGQSLGPIVFKNKINTSINSQILRTKDTSVCISLDGSITFVRFDSNQVITLPDSVAQQVFILYSNIILNNRPKKGS